MPALGYIHCPGSPPWTYSSGEGASDSVVQGKVESYTVCKS